MVLDPDPSLVWPAELINYLRNEAVRDADRTADVLKRIGLFPVSNARFTYTREFLLEFGAALRIWYWQTQGTNVASLGLPDARPAAQAVLHEAFRRHEDPSLPLPNLELSKAVLRITVNGWAWSGQEHLQADVRLDSIDEDNLIDVMADFLWVQIQNTRDNREVDPA